MGAVKWTKGQQDAINVRNNSVIVSAAAGSGKTAVLVERLVKILSDNEDRTPADKIVVVTFTNDAAAQMKQRLSEALSKAAAAEPQNEWLRKQQTLIHSADISTIHSFCYKLIRANTQELGVTSGFRVAKDKEVSAVKSRAIETVFERMYAANPDCMNMLISATDEGASSDRNLNKIVSDMYDFVMSIPFWENWAQDKLNELKKGFDSSGVMEKAFLADFSEKLARALKIAEEYSSAAEKIVSDYSTKSAVTIAEYDNLRKAIDKNLTEECGGIRKAFLRVKDASLEWNQRIDLSDIKFGTLSIAPRGKNNVPENRFSEWDAERFAELKSHRENAKDIIADLCKAALTSEEITADCAENYKLMSWIVGIVRDVAAEVRKELDERNELCFSDAEQLMVKLLCSRNGDGAYVRTPLAESLSENIRYIMVDEFQDINDIQSLIFRLLSRGGSYERNGTNLFRVGDLKQSIYLFRRANPKIFSDTLDNAVPYDEKIMGGDVSILLNQNFRSRKNVVNFVNLIFENIMSRDLGGTAYSDNEKLIYGANYPDDSCEDYPAEVILVDKKDGYDVVENSENSFENEDGDSKKTDAAADEAEEMRNVSAEAAAVVDRIKGLISEKKLVRDGGQLRPCEYRDFCILVRSNLQCVPFNDAMSAAGIPYYCSETSSYLKSREISVLINMLRIIDRPTNDIALTSVLMSSMFMLTPDEMAELRAHTSNRRVHIYTCINRALKDGGISESLSGKLNSFHEIYFRLRSCAVTMSLDRLIRSIYDSTDFISSVQVYSDGAQKRANLRMLINYACDYEANSLGGLSGFLRFLDSISENGGDFDAAKNAATENAVSVKNIHKSKGLEYPYVFLCGTAKEFNSMDDRELLQISNDLGFGLRVNNRDEYRKYKTFQADCIISSNRRDRLSEEMRLLYVALTRAKEQLFLTVPIFDAKISRALDVISESVQRDGKISLSLLRTQRSMLGWLWAALLVHPEFRKSMELEAIPDANSAGAVVTVSRYTFDGGIAAGSTSAAEPPDIELVRIIMDNLNKSYDMSLSEKTAKIATTEIAEEHTDKVNLADYPEFARGGRKLTASEAGVAMHTFMEWFRLDGTDAADEADRIAAEGRLSPAERASLNIKKLDGFLHSDLLTRMKKSPRVYREKKFMVGLSDLDLDESLGKEYNRIDKLIMGIRGYNGTDGVLQGVIDCFFEEEDGYVLVDYKTDFAHTEQELIDKYIGQLYLYSRVIPLAYGKKIAKAYIYSFCFNKAIELPLSEAL